MNFNASRLRNRVRSVYPEKVLKRQKREEDSTEPDFWSKRYAAGTTPWQTDHVPQRLDAFLRSLRAGVNVLVPGCGEDFRTLEAFRRAGHRVTAVDFSPIAVEAVKKALPEIRGEIVLGDFFSYNFAAAPFDLVYERTFLCSLPPPLWKNYCKRVKALLKPKGTLVGFFFYGKESDPPPYPLTESTAAEIFGNHFDLWVSEPVTDSLAIFGGKEKWQEWRLREH